jgi:hypothetical protein
MVLLLLARLVLGEFAHSMPQDRAATADSAAHLRQSACPDHASKPAGAKQGSGSALITKAGHSAAHDSHCCKSGVCQCPCVHISAMASPAPFVALVLLEHNGFVPASVEGLIQDRPGSLFRPPA